MSLRLYEWQLEAWPVDPGKQETNLMANYKKALPAGIGSRVIYTGSNVDAVVTLLSGISSTDYRIAESGELYVFGKLINEGDGVQLTTDEPQEPAPKATKAEIEAEAYRIDALVYDANLDAIIAFAGKQNVRVTNGTLYIKGVAVATNDAVYKVGGRFAGSITAAALAGDYTAE